MPELYKCKGKDCGYSTDDIHDFITHVVRENVPKAPEPVEPEPKTHRTVKDYLDCPECFPKFEKEFLARGYTKPKEEEEESLTL